MKNEEFEHAIQYFSESIKYAEWSLEDNEDSDCEQKKYGELLTEDSMAKSNFTLMTKNLFILAIR